jgi:hypothetical protein
LSAPYAEKGCQNLIHFIVFIVDGFQKNRLKKQKSRIYNLGKKNALAVERFVTEARRIAFTAAGD